MIEAIENFFAGVFGNNVILATILIAMVPIIELKGAIPFSMSHAIWKGYELNFGNAFLWGVLGSSIIVPILVLIYVPLINLLKRTKLFKKIAIKIEEKINTKKQNVENKIEANIKVEGSINEEDLQNDGEKLKKQNVLQNKSLLYKVLGVFLFVAIPLPFTGVWTGSCLAVVLGLGFWLSCLVVIAGNIIAGIIVSVFSSVLSPLVFGFIFLGLIAIFCAIYLIKKLIRKKTKNNID